MSIEFTCKKCAKVFPYELKNGMAVHCFADGQKDKKEYAVICPYCGHLHRAVLEDDDGKR